MRMFEKIALQETFRVSEKWTSEKVEGISIFTV